MAEGVEGESKEDAADDGAEDDRVCHRLRAIEEERKRQEQDAPADAAEHADDEPRDAHGVIVSNVGRGCESNRGAGTRLGPV